MSVPFFFFLLFLFLFFSTIINATSDCGTPAGLCLRDDGSDTCDASTILEVQSQTKGTTLDRVTTAEKNAIASPQTGYVVFDTDVQSICVYMGGQWQTLGIAIEASADLQEFTATGASNWTKPAGALITLAWCIGGGAGGDSGWGMLRMVPSGPNVDCLTGGPFWYHIQAGGNGGAPGSTGFRWMLATDLNATVETQVGTGGTGGTIGTNYSVGHGTAGGSTSFGNYLVCPGGGASSSTRNYTTSVYDGEIALQNLTAGIAHGPSTACVNNAGFYDTDWNWREAKNASNATYLAPTGGGAGASQLLSFQSSSLAAYYAFSVRCPSNAGSIIPAQGGTTTIPSGYCNNPRTAFDTTWCSKEYVDNNGVPRSVVFCTNDFTVTNGTDHSQSDWLATGKAGTGGMGGYARGESYKLLFAGYASTNNANCFPHSIGGQGGKYGGTVTKRIYLF